LRKNCQVLILQIVERLGKTYREKVLNDDQEKGLIENEEQNPEVKKKKKNLGSIKYKVNIYLDLWFEFGRRKFWLFADFSFQLSLIPLNKVQILVG
jgi:hypothetical protein